MAEIAPGNTWVVATATWDLFGERRVPGGTAAYVARTCEALGVRARLLVLAGPDADGEASLAHEVRRRGERTLTFRHEVDGGGPRSRRLLRLVQDPGHTLSPADVPSEWGEPDTLILAPLLPDEVDVLAFIDDYPAAEVALLAQGLQRAVVPDDRGDTGGEGLVMHRAQPSSVLLDAARPNVSIFLSQEEVELWPAGALAHLAARAARVVITDGPRGASIIDRAGTRTVAPVPARVVDTTGAGDVFASAFILGLRAGEQFAGRLAAACAAAAVEVVGPASLPPRSALEARLSEPDRGLSR